MKIIEKKSICGVDFTNISMDTLSYYLRDSLRDSEKLFIVTPNVDFIVQAYRDVEFRSIINDADLSLCDSMIVLWASRLLGRKLETRITGFDVCEMLLNLCQDRRGKVFLLGANEEALKLSADRLTKSYPRLLVAGMRDGYFDLKKTDVIIQEINKSGAEYLFVGMGSPKQERWVYQNIDKLKVKFIVCIGGLFCVFSGQVRRAPLVIQSCGLEWAWRLLHDPQRLWKRYLIDDMKFFGILIKTILERKEA